MNELASTRPASEGTESGWKGTFQTFSNRDRHDEDRITSNYKGLPTHVTQRANPLGANIGDFGTGVYRCHRSLRRQN
ncbi:MAG: hypothetical protein Kow00121_21230 [Elainellaceae cyanobacterium]